MFGAAGQVDLSCVLHSEFQLQCSLTECKLKLTHLLLQPHRYDHYSDLSQTLEQRLQERGLKEDRILLEPLMMTALSITVQFNEYTRLVGHSVVAVSYICVVPQVSVSISGTSHERITTPTLIL